MSLLHHLSKYIVLREARDQRQRAIMATPYKKTNRQGVQVEDTRIVVVMVGLPARGKSLIAQKGMRPSYLYSWHELKLTLDT